MDTSNKVWAGDWRKRVFSRIRATGYETITDFLAKSPADSYFDLAERLGEDVAALQLQWMQFGEANDERSIRFAAMDSFVREITYHLPKGWKQDAKSDFDTAGVYADWIGRIQEKQGELRPKAQAVWDALKKASPPIGWLPKGPDDPLIVSAFQQGWPQ
jgi:hypothetical protein